MLDLMQTSKKPDIRLLLLKLKLLRTWYKDMLFGLEEVFLVPIKILDLMWPKARQCMKSMDPQFADIIQFLEMECE